MQRLSLIIKQLRQLSGRGISSLLVQSRKRPLLSSGVGIAALCTSALLFSGSPKKAEVTLGEPQAFALGDVSHELPTTQFEDDLSLEQDETLPSPFFGGDGPFIPGGDVSEAGNPGSANAELILEVPGVGNAIQPATFESESAPPQGAWLLGTIEEVAD